MLSGSRALSARGCHDRGGEEASTTSSSIDSSPLVWPSSSAPPSGGSSTVPAGGRPARAVRREVALGIGPLPVADGGGVGGLSPGGGAPGGVSGLAVDPPVAAPEGVAPGLPTSPPAPAAQTADVPASPDVSWPKRVSSGAVRQPRSRAGVPCHVAPGFSTLSTVRPVASSPDCASAMVQFSR